MHAERSPLFGITVAVVVLCAECIGLVAYRGWHEQRAEAAAQRDARQEAERAAARAVDDAQAAKAKLDEILRELDALEAEVNEVLRTMRSHHPSDAEVLRAKHELRVLELRLDELRRKRSAGPLATR